MISTTAWNIPPSSIFSRDFYSLYDGTPANYLTFVAVHETSHQWWFEQVGNDQAQQPWLDEVAGNIF